jgi:hypothetical protein
MEHATVVTIPTIVHLMTAMDSQMPGDQHNNDVLKTREVFPEIFGSADHAKSVNFIWKRAAVQFKLDPNIGTVPPVHYHLKDFGAEPGVNREEIIFKCSSPPTEEEGQSIRNLKEKFGRPGFQGLQVFVLARIKSASGDTDMAGCAISGSSGVTGSAWVDVAVRDASVGFFYIMAHEIGHFLSLPHVQVPKGLMNPDPPGPHDDHAGDLSGDERERAHKRAVEVMKTQ